ncbi:hypothetical protein G7K71_06405 [Desulfofundulus sp. TPOSR]|uniref:Uncharacterized protein n=1 Tax=Desulfofundulus kuznetsovii (strain DSM 6115 / VKM B-1805 / 17) TaxID=760568 RepID=A0AAU8P7N5_DESK7|nr:hypothetical protein [Desulfofundulus sp. TPOSR]AEG13728.1 hypothetical protein Desku_0080 [Desulfofundulus kuznetsovii DSM 6115]NHM26626.1 hypothetical protein [Desulfofundulus sp. TPOSR]
MPEFYGGQFHPLSIPFLLMLSTRSDMEDRLSQLASFLEATRNALKTMRAGLEALHVSMMQLAEGASSSQPATLLPADIPVGPEPAPPDEVQFPDVKLPENKNP